MPESAMRVLIVSQFYHPEAVAASHRMQSFARYLTEQGHEVAVIAEKPNHPDGIIWPEYRRRGVIRREVDGVPVYYTWVSVSPKKSFITRISFYVSFMASAVAAARKVPGRFDIVLATSPPLFVGLSGWAISRLKRARFVFDVRDIWPDLAVAMGELTRPRVIRWAKKMEAFIYRKADGIVATTKGFCAYIRDMTGGTKPVCHVANGTVVDLFDRSYDRQAVRAEFGVEDAFVVTYAGNVGICQGLDHLLEAAERLVRTDPEVVLLVVGGGPVKERLVAEAERRGLSNLKFHPMVTREKAAAVMTASDVLLVPLADHPIYRSFIPSKLFDAMASGRPILLAVDGEARALLEEAGAGRYYPPEDGAGLADAIGWMRAHADEHEAMGAGGAAYVRTHFTRPAQAERLGAFLEEIAGGPPVNAETPILENAS